MPSAAEVAADWEERAAVDPGHVGGGASKWRAGDWVGLGGPGWVWVGLGGSGWAWAGLGGSGRVWAGLHASTPPPTLRTHLGSERRRLWRKRVWWICSLEEQRVADSVDRAVNLPHSSREE